MSIDYSRIQSARARAETALAEARAAAQDRLAAAADAAGKRAAGGTPLAEMVAWPAKEAAARAYAARKMSEADRRVIEDEAGLTGEVPAELAARILDHAARHRTAAAAIAGLRRACLAAIRNAVTPDEVRAAVAEAEKALETRIAG